MKQEWNLGGDGLFKDGWMNREEHSKRHGAERLERLGNYWGECYYGNLGEERV